MSGSRLDELGERIARTLARFSSRRSFLARAGVAMVGAPLVPLLPVARGAASATPARSPGRTDFERHAQAKDPNKCNYWRYCAIDGVLCSCCGGGVHSCPPGAEPSPISWIGTCVNPDDERTYIVAYRDCCGKSVCAAGKDCSCVSVDRELPIYRPQLNNDIVWCFGNQSASYHCSTAAIVAVADA